MEKMEKLTRQTITWTTDDFKFEAEIKDNIVVTFTIMDIRLPRNGEKFSLVLSATQQPSYRTVMGKSKEIFVPVNDLLEKLNKSLTEILKELNDKNIDGLSN